MDGRQNCTSAMEIERLFSTTSMAIRLQKRIGLILAQTNFSNSDQGTLALMDTCPTLLLDSTFNHPVLLPASVAPCTSCAWCETNINEHCHTKCLVIAIVRSPTGIGYGIPFVFLIIVDPFLGLTCQFSAAKSDHWHYEDRSWQWRSDASQPHKPPSAGESDRLPTDELHAPTAPGSWPTERSQGSTRRHHGCTGWGNRRTTSRGQMFWRVTQPDEAKPQGVLATVALPLNGACGTMSDCLCR